MFLPAPRGLRDPRLLAARRELLTAELTAQPLRAWRSRWLAHLGPDAHIPDFDPADAGTQARTLLVMEAPGPMAGGSRGSGFISVDNNDQTAANLWALRKEARLDSSVLMTNSVPWFLGPASIKPSLDEREIGAESLLELIQLLPDLRTVVCVGTVARRTWDVHVQNGAPFGLEVLWTYHPSPLAINANPDYRRHIGATLARARLIGE